ncbi:MAG TPA: SIR2 family protein [Blastocatellia bacterium]|nr:SIR2 family protein [Blastocatellia bacterium]
MSTRNLNLNEDDCFEIGGESLLPTPTSISGADKQLGDQGSRPDEVLDDIRVRISTLLKAETVSLLLGAGASVCCGGQLIGSVPPAVEQKLYEQCEAEIGKQQVPQWLKVFYLAVRACGAQNSPRTEEEIRERLQRVSRNEADKLNANFEKVLTQLYRWRSALPEAGGRLQIDQPLTLDTTARDLDEALQHATRALASTCVLPVVGKEDGLGYYRILLRKLLTRPLNLKRVNIFTLNYDTLVEQAADAEGIVLLDGFVGTLHRVFRPESYEQDLYFPAETTEGRVHRYDRVLHLYKLHGSITWKACEPTIDNPYGVQSVPFDPSGAESLLIYPTPAKYGETLGLPYSEMFRRFAASVVRPQSVLIVIGYGFGDEHVNAIIRQALAVPSFILLIATPSASSDFVKTLREQRDRRVWIAKGPSIGTFAGFVEYLLPDLRDEEIRKKVLETHRALSKTMPLQGDSDGK